MMSKYTKYDFEALREVRFPQMSDRDIMREYVMILHELEQLKEEPSEVYFEYCEPLDEAQLFLSGYLACMVCYENGFDV